MNKQRIRELNMQAAEYATLVCPNHSRDWYPIQNTKFAELIVRECARVIDRGDGEMSSMAETIWCNVCRDDILKHFGVEKEDPDIDLDGPEY